MDRPNSSLTAADITWPNSTVIGVAGALDAVRALKARDGGDIQVMGSLTVARWLLANDLVDEVNVMLEPVTLGGGKRLFPDGVHTTFKLKSAKPYPTGVVDLHYERAR